MGQPFECRECCEATPRKYRVVVEGWWEICAWCAEADRPNHHRSACCDIPVPKGLRCACEYRDEFSEAGNELDAIQQQQT